MSQMQTFAPSILIGGQTVTPPGWVWVLGFALGGCQWAIEEAAKPEFKVKVDAWREAQRQLKLDEQQAWIEERIAQLEAQLAEVKAQRVH